MICLTVARSPGIWVIGSLMPSALLNDCQTLGNFFGGLSGAIKQLTVTTCAVEIAPTRIRGGLVTFQAVW